MRPEFVQTIAATYNEEAQRAAAGRREARAVRRGPFSRSHHRPL